jgi:hypothetical protein
MDPLIIQHPMSPAFKYFAMHHSADTKPANVCGVVACTVHRSKKVEILTTEEKTDCNIQIVTYPLIYIFRSKSLKEWISMRAKPRSFLRAAGLFNILTFTADCAREVEGKKILAFHKHGRARPEM